MGSPSNPARAIFYCPPPDEKQNTKPIIPFILLVTDSCLIKFGYELMNFYYLCAIHASACSFPGVIAPTFALWLFLKSPSYSINECVLAQLFCTLVLGYSFLYYLLGTGADTFAGHRAMIFGKYSVFVFLSIAYFRDVITILAFLTGCSDAACYDLYTMSSSGCSEIN